MKTAAISIIAAAALAGCQTTSEPTAADRTAARQLSSGLAEAIGRCWFGDDETAFAGYIYSPEHVGGQPRILVAAKDDPGGRPALVIEIATPRDIAVYGPLAEGALGPRIAADIDRWRTGGTTCG